MLDYFQGLADGINNKINESPDLPNARRKYARAIANLGIDLYSGEKPVAWCGIVAPFDLLRTMGVASCYVEFIGGLVASTGAVGTFIEEAEHLGYASDMCSYHRSVIGAAEKGMMPVPEVLIATSCPCSGGVAVMENLSKMFSKDLFVLQIPQEISNNSIDFVADQLKDMVDFISDHTGEKLDQESLSETIEKTNKTRALMVDIYNLAKHRPSPTNGRDLSNFGIVMPLLMGTDEGIDIAQSYKDEFQARIDAGVGGIDNEKLRLMWIQNRIQFKHPLDDLLRDEYGAVIVVDELNDIFWDPIDPDDPFRGIAKRSIGIPFNGPIDYRLNHLKQLAEDYKIDGAVNPCNWGCRQGAGARGLVEEGLKEINVPVLNLEVDCVDLRNFAEGQLKTRIEAFMEMMDMNSSPWK